MPGDGEAARTTAGDARSGPRLGPARHLDSRALAQDEPIPQPEGDTDVTTFDETLSPYGQWVDTGEGPNDGRAWRPDPDVVGEDFQPYATGGHWVYSDWGWTWESDYPWGWAPYHYGRWALTPSWGWVWYPGHRLGPCLGRLAVRGWLHRLGTASPRGVRGGGPALAALLVLRSEQRLHLPRRVGLPAPGGPHPLGVRGDRARAPGGELRAGALVRRSAVAAGGACRGASRAPGDGLHPAGSGSGAVGPSLRRGDLPRARRPGPGQPLPRGAPRPPPRRSTPRGPASGDRVARAPVAEPLAGRLPRPAAPRRRGPVRALRALRPDPRRPDPARARSGTGARSRAPSRPRIPARVPRLRARPSSRAASPDPPGASALLSPPSRSFSAPRPRLRRRSAELLRAALAWRRRRLADLLRPVVGWLRRRSAEPPPASAGSPLRGGGGGGHSSGGGGGGHSSGGGGGHAVGGGGRR